MTDLPTRWTSGEFEFVAPFDSPMPTAVSVFHAGRLFVNFPRRGHDVLATVVEMVDRRPALPALRQPDDGWTRVGLNPAKD